jgi:hypothetical protein
MAKETQVDTRRPDQRHFAPSDCKQLTTLLAFLLVPHLFVLHVHSDQYVCRDVLYLNLLLPMCAATRLYFPVFSVHTLALALR